MNNRHNVYCSKCVSNMDQCDISDLALLQPLLIWLELHSSSRSVSVRCVFTEMAQIHHRLIF